MHWFLCVTAAMSTSIRFKIFLIIWNTKHLWKNAMFFFFGLMRNCSNCHHLISLTVYWETNKYLKTDLLNLRNLLCTFCFCINLLCSVCKCVYMSRNKSSEFSSSSDNHCVDDRILIFPTQCILFYLFNSTIYVNVISHKWLSIMHYILVIYYIYSLGGPGAWI